MSRADTSKALLRAYIDETGDRGYSGASSPFFAFAAIVVPDEDEPALRTAVCELRTALGVPPAKALHWKDHVKSYARRQLVASTLAELPSATVLYVVVEKARVPMGSSLRADQVIFYN